MDKQLLCEIYNNLKKDFVITMSPKDKESFFTEMKSIYQTVKENSKYQELKRALSCALILEQHPYASCREIATALDCTHVAVSRIKGVIEYELKSNDDKFRNELTRLRELTTIEA